MIVSVIIKQFLSIFSAAQKKRVTQVSQMYNTGFTVGEVCVNVFLWNGVWKLISTVGIL